MLYYVIIICSKTTLPCQFFLTKTVLILLANKMSCTHADGTKSYSSASEEDKTVQSSSMILIEKLAVVIRSGVLEKSEPLDNETPSKITEHV